MRTACVVRYRQVMETIGGTAFVVSDPSRFDAWCATCGEVTESDDTSARWCLECGDRRTDHE